MITNLQLKIWMLIKEIIFVRERSKERLKKVQ